METDELKIKYPSGFEQAVHMTKDEMEQHIRLMAAPKMFELGKVSSGKAAELAGMSRIDFLETCARYRVSIFPKNCNPIFKLLELLKFQFQSE